MLKKIAFSFNFFYIISISIPGKYCEDEAKADLCKELKKNLANDFQILLIGIVNNRLILITKELQVFEQSADFISESANAIFLDTQFLFKDRYPELYANQDFQDSLKIQEVNIYTHFDKLDSEFFAFCVVASASSLPGVIWDVKKNEYDGSCQTKGMGTAFLTISDQNAGSVYRFLFEDNIPQVFHGAYKNGVTFGPLPGESTNGILFSNPKKLCSTDSGNKIYSYSPDNPPAETCETLDWQNSKKSFIRNGVWYMMTKEWVYYCDKTVLDQTNYPVILNKKPYEDFILCRSDLWWVIVVIILVILLILLILACFMVGADYANRKKPGNIGNDRTVRSVFKQSPKPQDKKKKPSVPTKLKGGKKPSKVPINNGKKPLMKKQKR